MSQPGQIVICCRVLIQTNKESCPVRTAAQHTLDYALRYVAKNVPVFPVHYAENGKCSCGDETCKSVGKHPAVPGAQTGGHKHATIEESQVHKWFGERGSRRGFNIGASLEDSGYICLDVDPQHDGLKSLEELVRDNAPLPDTWVEETGEDSEGTRGQHYWFLTPPGKQFKKRAIAAYPGIDILANGYAIVAPSLHASGVRYETLTSLDDVTEAPEWILAMTEEVEPEEVLLGSTGEPTGIRPGRDVRKFLRHGGIAPGSQRSMACKAARALWGIWIDIEDAADLVFAALQKCEWSGEDWTENQVRRLVVDEYSKQPKALDNPVSGVPLATDLGRAYRLRSFARGNLKFDSSAAEWYTWDTTVWQANIDGEPDRLVHAMSMIELQEGQLSEEGADKRKEALKCQSAATISNILRVAQKLPSIACTNQVFDTDLFLLNCSNCVVDLRNGQTREQRREDMMTKSCRFAYRPGASSELWDRVINEATSGNEDLLDFLQLAFGYAATGDTREDTFFYLHGPGGSGKTTILEAVARVMGSYATSADPETFMLSQLGLGLSHRADLAALKDARLVTSSEIAQGSKFSTSTLNRLTGRDRISARIPYAKAPIVFDPQWTLFFAANHFPAVPGATKRDGFWRRVKVVPFDHALPREQMNPVLPHLLTREEHGEAILAWIIKGAMRWWSDYASQNRMMKVPRIVTQKTAGMQEQEDELADFIETLTFDPDAMTTRTELHQYYLGWCEHVGTKMPMKPRQFHPAFRSSVEGLDVDEAERRDARYWIGVAIPSFNARPRS